MNWRKLLLAVTVVAGCGAAGADELEAVKGRTVAMLMRGGGAERGRIERYVAGLDEAGRWGDINYESQQRGEWQPSDHLRRLREMAVAWRQGGGELEGDAELQAAIERGLGWWLDYNLAHPRWCPNWWYNDIFIPRYVGQLGMLVGEALEEETREKLMERLSWSKPRERSPQGANWVWLCEPVLYHGMLVGDAAVVREQFENIWWVVAVSEGEGIKSDMSFHQHGRQQQMGNYGLAFVETVVPWMWAATGTAHAPGREKVELMRGAVLDGQAWFVQKGFYDVNGLGRQIVMGESKLRILEGVLETMMEVDPAAAGAYGEVLRSIREPAGPNATVGNRWSGESVTMVHRRADWAASVRMTAAGFIANEGINDEGMVGGLVGLGSALGYTDAQDYRAVLQAYDWRRVPGSTAGRREGTIVAGGYPPEDKTKSAFAGGVSDGQVGAAAMEMAPAEGAQPIRWRKGWFFFDDAWVCLGEVMGAELEDEILTTVAQERLDGRPVVIGGDGARREVGVEEEFELAGPGAVVHGQVAYVFPVGGRLMVHAGEQRGSWYEMYPKPEEEKYQREVTREVFMLAVSHGMRAEAGGALAWVVLPTGGEAGARRFLKGPWLEVVASGAAAQAVWDRRDGTVQAAFFESARLELGDSSWLFGSEPLMVMLRRGEEGLRVWACDPTGAEDDVSFTLGGFFEEKEPTWVRVETQRRETRQITYPDSR